MRQNDRHGLAIALSQSELMLVLALVFLLLFYVARAKHTEDLEQLCKQSQLNKPENCPDDEAPTQEPEPEEEDIPGEDEHNEAIPVEDRYEEAFSSLVIVLQGDEWLESDNDKEYENPEVVVQTVSLVLGKYQEAIDEIERFLIISDIEIHGDIVATFSEFNDSLVKSKSDKKAGEGKKVGFDPCWPRDDLPYHYFAFDIEYSAVTQLFSIRRFRYQDQYSEERSIELHAQLPILNEYPKVPVDRDTILNYAMRLNEEKEKKYGSDCRLSTEINKEGVDSTIIEFVRDELKLYPIWL